MRVVRAGLTAAGAAGVVAALGVRRPVITRWPASILQAAPCTPASEAPGATMLLHAALGLASLAAGGAAGALANGAAVAAVTGPPGRGRLPAGRRARRRWLRAADVAYGPHPQQRLDVWAGAEAGPSAPVLVQVHGGGWTGGDKTLSAAPLLAHLAARGWVCVTIDYRLAPAHRLPDQIADVRAALEWVTAHVAEYGGDPGFVAISGGSAGGHLAALAAVTGAPVAAAVPFYGVHDLSLDSGGLHDLLRETAIGTALADDPAGWFALSPLHRAGPDAPPFLVVHGTTDTIVTVEQSRRFVARLREVSRQPVAYAELPHAQHGFDILPTARTAHTVLAVTRWLEGLRTLRCAAAYPAA
jgi:acetyl esterase/lipase